MVNCVRPSLTCHRHRVEPGRCQYSAQPGRIPIPILIPLMDIIFPADRPLRTCLSLIGREIERLFGFDRTQMNTSPGYLWNFFVNRDSKHEDCTHKPILLKSAKIIREQRERERDHCFKSLPKKRNLLNFLKNVLYPKIYILFYRSVTNKDLSYKVVRVGIPIENTFASYKLTV